MYFLTVHHLWYNLRRNDASRPTVDWSDVVSCQKHGDIFQNKTITTTQQFRERGTIRITVALTDNAQCVTFTGSYL